MTDDRIAEIEARARAATPGPWIFVSESVDANNEPCVGVDGGEVVTKYLGGIVECSDPYPRGDNCPTENMRFIAAARTDVPDLIAALREAQATIAAAHSCCEEARDDTAPGMLVHDHAVEVLAILDGGKP
jgi:hypothetical protein